MIKCLYCDSEYATQGGRNRHMMKCQAKVVRAHETEIKKLRGMVCALTAQLADARRECSSWRDHVITGLIESSDSENKAAAVEARYNAMLRHYARQVCVDGP